MVVVNKQTFVGRSIKHNGDHRPRAENPIDVADRTRGPNLPPYKVNVYININSLNDMFSSKSRPENTWSGKRWMLITELGV